MWLDSDCSKTVEDGQVEFGISSSSSVSLAGSTMTAMWMWFCDVEVLSSSERAILCSKHAKQNKTAKPKR
jgi:hypothetical protein